MTAISWATGSSGDWSGPTNWYPRQIPGTGDDVTIDAPDSYTVTISSAQSVRTLTLDAIGAVVADDSLLTLSDALTLAAGAFDLNDTGTIQGGTIATGGGSLLFLGGTLDGVTYDGTLDLTPDGASVEITDGLTLAGADGTGPGAIAMGYSGGAYEDSVLYFDGNQTIDNGTITENDGAILYTYDTLTLGPNLTIDLAGLNTDLGQFYDGAIFNEGTINAESAACFLNANAITNIGTIVVSGLLQTNGVLTNFGTLIVSGFDLISGGFANAEGGAITILGGAELQIYTAGFWTNDGLITVEPGGTLILSGDFTTAQLAGIADDGGTIDINGYMVNTGTTFAVGPGSRFDQVVLDGTIVGGTIQDAGLGVLYQGGTLDGVTYDGTLDMLPENSNLWIGDGGLVATGADGAGPGEIDVGFFGTLTFADTQTFDDATIRLEGPASDINQATLDDPSGDPNDPGGALTLGPNLTIDADGIGGGIGSVSYGGAVVNDGTINVEAYSPFTIAPYAFTNNGTINVFGGQTVYVDNLTNIVNGTLVGGFYSVGLWALLQFNEAFTTLDADLTLYGAGSSVDFNGSADLLESDLTDIAAGGALRIMGGRDFSTANDLTVDGTLQLTGGTLQAGAVTIDPTGMLIGDGTATVANGGSTVAQGGTLDIAGNVTGGGGLYIDPGATLELGGTDADTVTFQGADATLLLDHPQDFSGQIAGFGLTDAIDLGATDITGVTPLSSTAASTTLKLTLLGASPVDITLLGDFIGDTFMTPADRAGTGTDLTIGTFQRPILTPSGHAAAYAQGGPPVALDGALGVADAGSAILASATVAITGGFLAGDALNFTDQDGITGSYDAATGVLALTGSAGLAAYQAALESITFSSASANPTNNGADTARTITWVADNGAALDNISPSVTTAVAIGPASQRPVLANPDGVQYLQGGPAVAVDPLLAVSEAGTDVITGATVSITNAVRPGDALAFTAQNGITGSYANGVLSLSGAAGLAAYQAALASVTFSSSNDDLTDGGAEPVRTVAMQVTDSAGASNVIDSTVYLHPQAPTFADGYATVDYAVGGSPQAIDSALSVTDPAVADLTDASVTIDSGYLPGDVLGFVDQNGITGSYADGMLTLSGTAPVADYQAALDSVTYSSTAADPGAAGGDTTRGIFFTADDLGQGASTGSTVDLTGLPPAGGSYALAAPTVAPATENFGAVHVGDSPRAALVVSNTAAAPSEGLDASVGSTSPAITASGSISLLAAGQTDATSLLVGLLTTADGIESGTVTVGLQSDGTGTSGAGLTPLPSQAVEVAGTVYAYAAPVFSATALDLGAARVGDPALQGAITLSDGVAPDPYQESLVYAAGGDTGTIVSGASQAIDVTLGTGTAGDFTGADADTETVDLTSTGAGTSGLADTPLTPVQVTLTGAVYATAVAQLGTTVVDLGPLHPGQAGSAALTVSNAATGALTDLLEGGFTNPSAGPFSVTGSLGAGLAAGASTSFTIGFSGETGTGTWDTFMPLAFTSHDAAQADVAALGATSVELQVTVQAYAVAAFEDLSGPGTFAQAGTAYTLNLGSFAAGGGPVTVGLGVLNAATSIADALSGGFTVSGSAAFANAGLAAFGGLGAGQADTAPTVTLSTAAAGTFSETITLDATGSNSSGYSGALAPETLTITGTVVDPVLSAPASLSVVQGAAAAVAASLAEANSTAGEMFTVTISDANGVLSAAGPGVSGSGTTHLTITSTLGQVNTDLGSLTDTDDVAGPDSIALAVADGYGATAARSIAVTAAALAPVLSAPASLSVVQGTAAAVAVSLAEVNSTAGEMFTVSISDTNGVLAAAGPGVSGSGTTHLTITGTLGQINTDLGSLTDTDAVVSPDVITLAVTDGYGNIGPSVTTGITVAAVVQPPVLANGSTVSYVQGGAPVLLDPALAASDVSSDVITGATVSVVAGGLGGDTLTFAAQGGIAGTYANGVLTLTGAASLAAYTAALDSITYSSSDADPTAGGTDATRTVAWQVSNAGGASNVIDTTVAVAPEAPTLGGAGNTVDYATGGMPQAIDAALTVSDPPVGSLTGATVTISSGYLTGDVLGFVAQNGITGSYADGTLALSGAASVADYQTALASVTYSSTAADPAANGTDATRGISFTATNLSAVSAPVSSTVDLTGPATTDVAPTLSGPAGETVGSDQIVDLPGFVVADAQSQGKIYTVTLTDRTGALAAAVSGDGSVAGNRSTRLTLTGSLGDVNAELASLTYTGVDPGPGVSATDTIAASVSDGDGGTATASTTLTVKEAATLVTGLGGPSGFGTEYLAPNDDGSTEAINITAALPDGLDLFGTFYDSIYINNNGNITTDAPLSTYTPSPIGTGLTGPIIAPYWADVYTLNGAVAPTGGNTTGSNLVWYDVDAATHTVTITWDDVGYYYSADKVDAFQLQLIAEPGGGTEIKFIYQDIQWTTGTASGGVDGLGGHTARVGFAAGNGLYAYEIPASTNQAALLALPYTIGNTGTAGVYAFYSLPDLAPPGGSGAIYPDPHLTTFDGLHYDFQTAGEFVLVKDASAGTFQVQVRLSEPVGASAYSVITELAIQVGADVVTIDSTRTDPVWVDGVAVDLTSGTIGLAGGLISRNGNQYVVALDTGEEVVASVSPGAFNVGGLATSLGISVTVYLGPNTAHGQVEGLLGNYNGDAAEDLTLADGTVEPTDMSQATLYGAYADAWRVTQATSLLDYGPGQTTATFTDTSYPGSRAALAAFPTAVVAAAVQVAQQAGITDPGLQQAAAYDYLVTGDAAIVSVESNLQQQGVTTAQQAAFTPASPAPAMAGIIADATSEVEAASGATTATFQIYRSGDTSAAATVDYAVVAPDDSFVGLSSFGGVLPSGAVTFAAGQTSADLSISIPDGIGDAASKTLEVQVSAAAPVDVVGPFAQETIVNSSPTAGAAPIFGVELDNDLGLLPTQVGDTWTFDLGALQQFQTLDTGTLSLAVENLAPSGADLLDGAVVASGNGGLPTTLSSSFSNLAPGNIINIADIGIQTSVAGVITEDVEITPDDTNASGYAAVLPTETIVVTGTVYALAQAAFATDTVDFGAVRQGSAPAMPVGVTNDGPAGAEALDANVGVVTGAANGSGAISLLPVGETSTAITVGLNTVDAGAQTGAVTIDPYSDGTGGDGAGTTALFPQTIDVSGSVYREAAASVTLGQSTLHVGDAGIVALTVTNTDPADGYSETLIASLTSATGQIAAAAMGPTGEIAAGGSDGASLAVRVSTATAGTVTGTATIALTSDGGTGAGSIDGLGQIALAPQTTAVSVTIDNYAVAAIEDVSGPGTLTRIGGAYTLNLGVVNAGAAVTVGFGVLNAASGPADNLSGSFAVSGSAAFANAGLAAFGGLGAGQADTAPTVTLSTTAAGTFSETITLDATGSNSSGYSGALAPETLTITGTVLGPLTAAAPAQAAVGIGQTDPIAGLSLSEAGAPGNERFTVTVADTSGILTANGAGVGLTGAGTHSLTISGPLASVNAALATVKDTEATATSDTLTLTANDAQGHQAAASVALTVNAAPVVTGPAAVVVGIGQADPVGGVSVAEAGLTAGETFIATVQDQRGLLSASGAGGATVAGAGTVAGLTITGTLAQVNAALATLTDSAGDTASDKILVFVTDSLGNHAHAASIAVTTNGKPVLAAPAAATVGVGQPSAVAGISVSESGTTAGETFSVVASDMGGALSASGAGGASIAGAGTGSLTIGGTLAQVNAALATLKDAAPATPSDTLTLQVTDSLHNTGAASVALTVNGPPAIAAPATATVAAGQTVAIGGLSLSETGNTAGERFSVTVSDVNGLLTASGAGVTLTGSGTTSLTIGGQLAQVNAALATLKDSDATAPADTLTLAASDAYGNTASKTVAVTVNAAPVVQAPASATVVLGQAVAIGGVGIAESGSTAGEIFTVTVQDQRGLLSATGLGVTGSGTVAGLSITGTLAQVNAALATLTDSVSDGAPDKISVFATDSYGNHAHAGGIAVGVNGKPVLAAPAAATVAVGQATTIAGVSLAESGATTGEIFTVTLSDTAGLLTANGAGVTLTGAGTTSLTISGALPQVNAALATLADTAAGVASDSIGVAARDSYGGVATAASIPVTVSGVAALAATASVRAAALHLGGVADPAWGTGEAGVTVSLLNAMGTVIATAVTTGAGQASFGNLAPGTYRLQYAAPAGQGFVPGGPDNAAGVTAPFALAAGQALIAPAGDLIATLALNGTGLSATPAAGGYLVTGNAADSTLTLGNYSEYVTLTGGGDTVTTGNGSETIALSGAGNTVTVGIGNSVINAGSGGAVVHAAGGDVTITAAGAGNLLDGGSGLSFLNADGSANNVFMLAAAGTPVANMTTVSGFNAAAGDILDLKHTLAGTDILPDLSNLASFVTAAAAGPNTVLLVDPTGGHAAPVAFAVLEGTQMSVGQLQALHVFSIR